MTEWSCIEAAECVSYVSEELASRGLISGWVSGEEVDSILTRCSSCRGRKPSVKKCRGWCLNFTEAKTLQFIPLDNGKGSLVQLAVRGFFDFRRKNPGVDSRDPLAGCSAMVTISDAMSGQLLIRHHVDLANQKQHGSVWHYQVEDLIANSRLDRPRIPALPIDFILFIELLLYNFANQSWGELRRTNPWRDWVKRSETLVLAAYAKRLELYRGQEAVADSWLAAQCNETSGWNPRPI
jgi:hypothetical protein